MPVNVQERGKRHQLRVTHDLLPRAFFATFDTEREGRDYGDQLQAMLDRGVVPQELLAGTVGKSCERVCVSTAAACSTLP